MHTVDRDRPAKHSIADLLAERAVTAYKKIFSSSILGFGCELYSEIFVSSIYLFKPLIFLVFEVVYCQILPP